MKELEIINIEEVESSDEFVYDVTTQSSTFMCNGIYVHNCGSHSIENLKKYGLKLMNLPTVSSPPNNITSLNGQLITFIASIQAYYAGAIGLAYLNTFYAPFCLGLSKEDLYQNAQFLIFSLSQCAFSRGSQVLFCDANIDLSCPEFFKNVPAIVSSGNYATRFYIDNVDINKDTREYRKNFWVFHKDKKKATKSDLKLHLKNINKEYLIDQTDFDKLKSKLITYGDYEKQIQDFAEVLMQVWEKGDANGQLFTFPKLQLHCNEKTFQEDSRENNLFKFGCQMASDKGITNFVFDRDAISLSQCVTIDKPLLFKDKEGIKFDYFPYTKEGWSTVQDFEVIGHDGCFQKVDKVFLKKYEGEIYNITLQNGDVLSVTPDHPFLGVLTLNQRSWQKHLGREVVASNLQKGNRLQWIDTKCVEEGIKEIKLSEYDINNNLQKNGNKIRAKWSHGVSIEDTIELNYNLGRFIGFFMAEGSFDSHDVYTTRMRMSFNETEVEFISFCAEVIESFGVNTVIRDYPKLHVTSLEFSSNLLYTLLTTFIGGKKSPTKYFKEICLKTNMDFRQGLISGLFDGDGYFLNKHKTVSVGLHVSSEKLTESVKVILNTLGIKTTKVRKRISKNPRNVNKKCFSYDLVVCVKDIPKIKSTYINKIENKLKDKDYIKSIYKNGILIKNIEKSYYKGLVYNLEMKDVHEYSLQGVRSKNCCRLTEQVTDMSMIESPETLRFVGFQNVSINLPQAALRAKGDYNKTIDEIKKTMDLAMKAHIQKKKYIQTLLDTEGSPLRQMGIPFLDGNPYADLEKATYIIGIIGLNECVQNITGNQLHEDEETYKMGIKIITQMYLYTKKLKEEYNLKVVLEETPGESSNARLSKIDYNLFPEGRQSIKGNHKTGNTYYTNSVHLEASADVSILERIEKQSKFAQLIEAGSITHVFLGEQQTTTEAIYSLVKKTFENTKCAQLTISPELVFCEDCGCFHKGFDGYL